MEKKEFEEYVNSRYNTEVMWYDTKSIANQNAYKKLQWILIIFSSLTPVLIALDFGFSNFDFLKWVAVITAVIVGIATVSQRTFKYYENWINYRTVCENLRKEKYLHSTGTGDYTSIVDKDSLFVERVENWISKENSTWINTFHKRTSENN